MADLHPSYPKEGADQQDAHTRSPRNFASQRRLVIKDVDMSKLESDVGRTVYNFNEKDQGPETVGGKDPYSMSTSELRKLGL